MKKDAKSLPTFAGIPAWPDRCDIAPKKDKEDKYGFVLRTGNVCGIIFVVFNLLPLLDPSSCGNIIRTDLWTASKFVKVLFFVLAAWVGVV